MTVVLRATSIVLTAGLLAGAVAVGGGALPGPTEIARSAREAARNTRAAAENAELAAERSASLARVLRNVASQLEASRRLLDLQLRIERAAGRSLGLAFELGTEIDRLGDVVAGLEARMRRVTDLSSAVGDRVEATERAGEALRHALAAVEVRYEELTEESRELARKARGYRRLWEAP